MRLSCPLSPRPHPVRSWPRDRDLSFQDDIPEASRVDFTTSQKTFSYSTCSIRSLSCYLCSNHFLWRPAHSCHRRAPTLSYKLCTLFCRTFFPLNTRSSSHLLFRTHTTRHGTHTPVLGPDPGGMVVYAQELVGAGMRRSTRDSEYIADNICRY